MAAGDKIEIEQLLLEARHDTSEERSEQKNVPLLLHTGSLRSLAGSFQGRQLSDL